MTEPLLLSGIIRNVWYQPTLIRPLNRYRIDNFDINLAAGCGSIEFAADHVLGYSKWVSPKRTRSYPYARIYQTLQLPKRVTIIPVIKDEGLRGDCDRINAITVSMMNLLNVYVIFAWYDNAKAHPRKEGKITSQRFDSAYINEKFLEIASYQQTALHWNVMHFERDFAAVYQRAIDSYQRISEQLVITLHSSESHQGALTQFFRDEQIDSELFRSITLSRSKSAAHREILVSHLLEYLGEGTKAYISLTNYLGGEYHLTIDEIVYENGLLILQESKNTTKDKLPSRNDILDGLLKLILFANIDELSFAGMNTQFKVRLKLTGNITGTLSLPTNETAVGRFAEANQLRKTQHQLLSELNAENKQNPKLNIVIAPNIL
jgi:hypothetical protein